MPEDTDFWNRVRDNNGFRNTVPYPKEPTRPPLLSKSANDLTEEDLANLWHVKESFKTAQRQYGDDMALYREGERKSHEAFREALLDNYEIKPGPMADVLYSAAWDEGHHAGFSEVANVFGKYAGIYKVHVQVLKEHGIEA